MCDTQTQNDVKQEIEGMGRYIGCKIIAAKPMDHHTFLRTVKDAPCPAENQHGYEVVYPDGYKSWSPKNVFESAYRKVTVGEYKLLT